MEYQPQSSYKNYLPSKKIQIIIGILIAILVAYYTIPWIIGLIRKSKDAIPLNKALVVTIPTGDPTSRDTDGDGVADWQEIIVGLDVYNPFTKAGVPDLTTFQNIRNQVGASTFDQAAGEVTDTDKVSLTIYDALSKDSIKNAGISVAGAQTVTSQELYNYIAAQQKEIKVYSKNDLNIVPGTLENNQTYAKKMNQILADDAVMKDGPEKIQAYLNDTADRSSINPVLASLQKKIVSLLAAPVPTTAVSMHVDIINAAQGIYQLVNAYDPSNDDPTAKISTVSLVQDYLINATKSFGLLKIYLSVALDKNGYQQ